MSKVKIPADSSRKDISQFVKKNKINILGLVILMLIFAGIVLTTNYYSLTGLYLLEQKEVLENSTIIVKESSFVELELDGSPESLSLSGYLLGEGTVRVYLAHTGSVMLDSSHLSKNNFENICEDSCSLVDVPSKIKLWIEIDDADTSLVLESVKYSTINHLPKWIGSTYFVIAKNSELTLNLDMFVEEFDGDELVYSVTSNKDIDVSVTGSILVLTPKPEFTGQKILTVVVSDMKETLRQDINIEVSEISEREQEFVNSPIKLDNEVLDEIEIKGSSDVIVVLKDKYQEDNTEVKAAIIKEELGDFKKDLVLTEEDEFGISVETDGNIKKEYVNLKALSLEISSQGFEKLKQNPCVEGIFANKEFSVALQDSIPLIQADLVEIDPMYQNSIVSVCVLDTGIDYNHELFVDSILEGYNALDGGSVAQDDNNHGTHVSGIVKKVYPDVKIVPVKVCDGSGACMASDILSGIDYCIANKELKNIQVISGSFGDKQEHAVGCTGVFDSTFNYANNLGMISVFSSGNEGYQNGVNYPACSRETISVGSVSKSGIISSFSNLPVDLLAPGENINSSVIGGYGVMSGTSMSAPHVAGTAAILKQIDNSLTIQEIKTVLASGTVINNYPNLNTQIAFQTLLEQEPENVSSLEFGITAITDCGTTISSAGKYNVTSYLSTSGATDCIIISSDDVEIDCMNNHIVSAGTGKAFENSGSRDNTTIKNCFISGFNYGIGTQFDHLSVINTTFNATKAYGIYLTTNDYFNVTNNKFINLTNVNGYALYAGETTATAGWFVNNQINHTKGTGVYLSGSAHQVKHNFIDMHASTKDGISLANSGSITFYNNTIVNLSTSSGSFGFQLAASGDVDNTLTGNNLVNGTNVSQRWYHNKKHLQIDNRDYDKTNLISFAGLIVAMSQNVTINKSTFTSHPARNVYAEGILNLTVQGNLINDSSLSSGYSLNIVKCQNVTVRNNKIGYAEYSIELEEVNRTNIIENNITFNADRGLNVYGACKNITVFKNRFAGSTGRGATLGSTTGGYSIDYLNFSDNSMYSSGSAIYLINSLAITEDAPQKWFIQYNNLTTKGDGIEHGSSSGSVSGVTISYNNITGREATSSSGILLAGDASKVHDNNISYFQYGVEFSGSPEKNNVTNNNITDPLTFGMYFQFSGGSTVSQRNFLANNSIFGWKHMYHYWGLSNVTIDNFEINQNQTMYPAVVVIVDCKNVTIRNMNITSNYTSAGIWLTNVSDVYLDNTTIKNVTYGIGMHSPAAAQANNNVTIIRNKIMGLTEDGIYDDNNGHSVNLTFYNNTLLWGDGVDYGIYVLDAATKKGGYNISANNISIGWEYGIYNPGLDFCSFYDNYFDNIDTYGLYLAGQNNTVYNNTFRDIDVSATSSAIYITGSGAEYNRVEHNYIGNASRGIYLYNNYENNTIVNNTIYNCSGYGMYIDPSDNTAYVQQQIKQNTICHNKIGVLFSGTKVNISSTDFRDNYFCIENIYPKQGGNVSSSTPLVGFNITNLFNRSTTNCTLYINGVSKGTNSSLAVEHANQTILSSTIGGGEQSLNISCLDDYANKAVLNNISFSLPATAPTHSTPWTGAHHPTSGVTEDPNLVSYWQFEKHSNTTNTGIDTMERNNCTLAGPPTWTADGRIGSVYEFDGENDDMDCGFSQDFNISSNMAVSVWIKHFGGAIWKDFVGRDGGGANRVFSFRIDNPITTASFIVWNETSSAFTSSNTIVTNEWQHVVGVHNGTHIITYVNGIAGTATAFNGNIETDTEEEIRIGSASGNRLFNGTIDEVMIFNRSLSASEVMDIYLDAFPTNYTTNITTDQDLSVSSNNTDDNSECYDKETEIMTTDGWKYFNELEGNEIVQTLNPITKQPEFQSPTAFQAFERDGEMYRINTDNGDLLVSPEHKVYVREEKIGVFNKLWLMVKNLWRMLWS